VVLRLNIYRKNNIFSTEVKYLTVYAELKESELKGLQECEDEMGVLLVAYKRPSPPAEVSPDTLEKIKLLEEETGLKLVAYE